MLCISTQHIILIYWKIRFLSQFKNSYLRARMRFLTSAPPPPPPTTTTTTTTTPHPPPYPTPPPPPPPSTHHPHHHPTPPPTPPPPPPHTHTHTPPPSPPPPPPRTCFSWRRVDLLILFHIFPLIYATYVFTFIRSNRTSHIEYSMRLRQQDSGL